MKTFTFSGMVTCTVRSDFNVTVTLEDIVETYVYEQPELTMEDVQAWTDEQVRAYVKEHMLDDLVEQNISSGHVYNTYLEYDPDTIIYNGDAEFVVNEEGE